MRRRHRWRWCGRWVAGVAAVAMSVAWVGSGWRALTGGTPLGAHWAWFSLAKGEIACGLEPLVNLRAPGPLATFCDLRNIRATADRVPCWEFTIASTHSVDGRGNGAYYLRLPIPIPLFATLLVATWICWPRRPLTSDVCPHCGYSLFGLPVSARCPECGRPPR